MPEVDLGSLVQAAAAGDAVAFDELYRRFEAVVYRLCVRLLGSEYDAEDAAVEVWQTVWTKLHRLQHPEAFTSWLRQTTVRTCGHRTRRRRWWQWFGESITEESEHASPAETVAADAAAEPEARALENETRDLVQAALSQLSPEHREVVVLHHLEGLGLTEISALTGIQVGTLKSRLGRARRHLASLLADKLG